jgi:hypothetical protein
MLVWWIGIPMGALLATTWVMILRRAGLLALIAMLEAQNCIEASSTTTDWSRWYAAAGFVGPAVVVLLALYGFRVATAGRPLFKFRLLAD